MDGKKIYTNDYDVLLRNGFDDIPLAAIESTIDEIRKNGRLFEKYYITDRLQKKFTVYPEGSRVSTWFDYNTSISRHLQEIARSDIFDTTEILVDSVSGFWENVLDRLEKELPIFFEQFKDEFDIIRKVIKKYD